MTTTIDTPRAPAFEASRSLREIVEAIWAGRELPPPMAGGAITPRWMGPGLLYLLDNPADLETVTLKLALATSSFTPNIDTTDFRDDFTANELSNASGYTTGGVTLTGVTWSYDSASDQVRLDFDDPSWTFSGTRTWRYGPLYIDTAGADSTDPVVGYLDWGTDQTVSTPYTLTIDPAGLLYIDIT